MQAAGPVLALGMCVWTLRVVELTGALRPTGVVGWAGEERRGGHRET